MGRRRRAALPRLAPGVAAGEGGGGGVVRAGRGGGVQARRKKSNISIPACNSLCWETTRVQGETEAGGGGAVGRGGQLGGRQGEGVQEEVRSAQVRGERGQEDLQIALPLYCHGALGGSVVLIPSTGRRAAQNFRRCCCCSSSVIRVLRGCNQRRRGGSEGVGGGKLFTPRAADCDFFPPSPPKPPKVITTG